jgi:surface antigen
VAVLTPGLATERPRYRAIRRDLLAAGVALLLGLPLGGCSFSYQLDSLWGKSKDDGSQDITGSIRPAVRPKQLAMPGAPEEGDLVIARAAANEVLTRGGKDASMPWENPQTGSRGTVTPIASAYSQDGLTCRDFLASFVRNGSESWMQGEACRVPQGKWEVRQLKPRHRT